jgi:hypothetical protein
MIYNSIEIKTNLHGGKENMDFTREMKEQVEQLEVIIKYVNETLRVKLLEQMHWINREWDPTSEISNLKYRRDIEEVQMKLDVNAEILNNLRREVIDITSELKKNGAK